MADPLDVGRDGSRFERAIQDVRVVRLDTRTGHSTARLGAASDLQRKVSV